MNRILPLLLILLLLTGCAAQDPIPPSDDTPSMEASEPEVSFLEPMEESHAAQRFGLPESVTGFLPLGSHLLFFSGTENTTLTLVDPARQQVISTHETGTVVMPGNGAAQILSNGFSYFSSHSRETVVLDNALQEVRRIAAPEALSGMPLLSKDGNTLFYCTASAIRALDTSTGISRILREAAYPVQTLSGILLEDSVLQVSITETDDSRNTLFLCAETGQLLADHGGNILPETIGSRYYLRQQNGNQHTILFGTAGKEAMVLKPWFAVDHSFFLGDLVLTSFVEQNHLALHLYSLESGLRTACFLGIPSEVVLLNASRDDLGYIWLFGAQPDGSKLLYRWDPDVTGTKDTTNYISPRYTRQEPDLDALTACRLYARDLSHRHGIEILVYTDAVEMHPWDYELEYEYDAPTLYQELELLDRRLSHYPAGFLQTLAGKFDGIKICIVHSIHGTPESGSTDMAGGIQFWNGYEACIVLAAGHDTERTLYHELCHLMDTVVLMESIAYDGWEDLNPVGFSYANSTDHSMNADDWRQAGWESFLDNDALSYPKEDRARIMEYAMTSGNADRFESPYLQAKLKLLCTGIREAFDLQEWTGPLLWEQYLHTPITPGK